MPPVPYGYANVYKSRYYNTDNNITLVNHYYCDDCVVSRAVHVGRGIARRMYRSPHNYITDDMAAATGIVKQNSESN